MHDTRTVFQVSHVSHVAQGPLVSIDFISTEINFIIWISCLYICKVLWIIILFSGWLVRGCARRGRRGNWNWSNCNVYSVLNMRRNFADLKQIFCKFWITCKRITDKLQLSICINNSVLNKVFQPFVFCDFDFSILWLWIS